MGRQPCCDKVGLKRGSWTIEEDHRLVNFILNNGIHCWRSVPKLAGLLRCGKSCRLRWINYLRPDLKRGALSEAEEDQIIQLHASLGNRWSKIASHFPGRTDNEIKNIWNTKIKKRLKLIGLDPVTHQPINETEKEEEKNDTNPDLNSSIGKEENSGKIMNVEKESEKQELETIPKESEAYEITEFLEDYEMMLTNQESNSPLSSMGESSNISVQEESIPKWVESVDSIFSWDCFNQLADEFFCFDDSLWI